jgi:uncharacterized protein YbgA (DUF1722 family)/uncharacterized protein YbbK (DUF523 family)
MMMAPEQEIIRVGVSACLLGQAVRYDAGHKYDSFVGEMLARHFALVPVCPEVEAGFGVPREPIRLVRDGRDVRMITNKTGRDLTAAMRRFARRRVRELEGLGLAGYIFKKGSPSCGVSRVSVYASHGTPSATGTGLFAAEVLRTLASLPVEDEGRLHDPTLRESFIERVFAYHRVRNLFRPRWTIGDLVGFHGREKLMLMAHDPAAAREIGRLVAGARAIDRAALRERYESAFLQALARPAPRPRHVNVLQHAAGYFKALLNDDERREIHEVLEDYRNGLVPLIVPITLLRHHVRRHRVDYLAGQTYLEPHPKELMLRNHV